MSPGRPGGEGFSPAFRKRWRMNASIGFFTQALSAASVKVGTGGVARFTKAQWLRSRGV